VTDPRDVAADVTGLDGDRVPAFDQRHRRREAHTGSRRCDARHGHSRRIQGRGPGDASGRRRDHRLVHGCGDRDRWRQRVRVEHERMHGVQDAEAPDRQGVAGLKRNDREEGLRKQPRVDRRSVEGDRPRQVQPRIVHLQDSERVGIRPSEGLGAVRAQRRERTRQRSLERDRDANCAGAGSVGGDEVLSGEGDPRHREPRPRGELCPRHASHRDGRRGHLAVALSVSVLHHQERRPARA